MQPGAVNDEYVFTNGECAVIPDQQELKYSISHPAQHIMTMDHSHYTARLLVAHCIVIIPDCVRVCLWVCYHDNSKLRASILTKLGL